MNRKVSVVAGSSLGENIGPKEAYILAGKIAQKAGELLHDLDSRKEALSQCDWMSDAQKENIEITSNGIIFKKESIILSLSDEEKKYKFEEAQDFPLPTGEQWLSILRAIGGDDSQKKKFLASVLKMNGTCYWSATQKGDMFTFLPITEREVKPVSWHHREMRFSVRTLSSK